eukprot:g13773.t1
MGGMLVAATRDIEAGEEVFFTYSQLSISELYRTYGFTLPLEAMRHQTFTVLPSRVRFLLLKHLPPSHAGLLIEFHSAVLHPTVVAALKACASQGKSYTKFLRELLRFFSEAYDRDPRMKEAIVTKTASTDVLRVKLSEYRCIQRYLKSLDDETNDLNNMLQRATRGDPPLLLALKGYERVHLCRHDSCPEDGQHFKSYVLARQLNPEKFHLMSTAAGAQRSGSRLMGWFFSKADQTAKKLKDYASESEREEAAVVEPEKEKRQCVTKVFAAGLLMSQTERAPGLEDVERLSQEFFRLEQARLAVEAEGVMGHPEAKVAPVEHELRMYAHDILKPHHDKDYRAAVSPLAALEEIRIIVVRADYKGDLLLETVVGSQWTHHDVWVMISKGHMTLLQPPSKTIGEALARKEVYHTPCLGFRYFWHQRHDQAKRPGNHCAQTLQDQERRRQGGSRHVWMFEENRLLASPVSVYGRGGARRQFMEREGTPAWC